VTKIYIPSEPIWCAGCGHFGVEAALRQALVNLDVDAHKVAILAGIGCSGTIQNNIGTYGYHALHGRVLSAATGMAIANPDLLVIAAGGDGDGYAIGMGHLVHSFKRNPGLVYIVMNNGTYGLTKGQNSPATDPEGGGQPLDAALLGLAVPGTTFIARGFSGWPDHLEKLMVLALTHAREKRGFAFLEVMSPCVTYNDTYPAWSAALCNLDDDDDHNPSDRMGVVSRCTGLRAEGRIPAGLLYSAPGRALETTLKVSAANAPVHLDIEPARLIAEYRQLLEQMMV